MYKWERREAKLKAKKERMPKHNRRAWEIYAAVVTKKKKKTLDKIK